MIYLNFSEERLTSGTRVDGTDRMLVVLVSQTKMQPIRTLAGGVRLQYR